ncbi:MAG: hypothetical protein PSX80_03865 [bacterium]|nr:hypothetical protein [bacterium]
MQNKRKRIAEIEESIRRILFDDWDPIGINDMAPPDEYDSYIGGIYRLIASRADAKTIEDHLRNLEITKMEVSSGPHRKRLRINCPD